MFFLPLIPVPLGAFFERIRARLDDCCNFRPKLRFDLRQHWPTTAVLHGIMEQGCNCLCLCSAVIEHDCRHCQHMRDVGNLCTLPCLFAMEMRCQLQGFIELT